MATQPKAKVLTVDLDEESYNKGVNDGYASCNTTSDYYKMQYRYKMMELGILVGLLILVIALIFVIGKKARKINLEKYDMMMKRQKLSVGYMEKTTVLLEEISRKLDKN